MTNKEIVDLMMISFRSGHAAGLLGLVDMDDHIERLRNEMETRFNSLKKENANA